MKTLRLSVLVSLLASAWLLSACATKEQSSSRGGDGERRVYNPQTRNYEWQRPGEPPTSPGADRTRRAAYD